MRRYPRFVPRSYTLLALLVFGLVAGPAMAGPLPFTTTELIAGNNAPAVNGANLLAAVGAAGPNTLIKLEPGLYDLQGDQIVLPNFVDIEGSGRDITTIFSDLSVPGVSSVIDVAPGINGEIRDLTVLAAADVAIGITAQSDELLLTEVNVELESNDQSIGVLIDTGSPRLDEVFVRVLGSSGNATGIQVGGGSGAVLANCLVFASNVLRNATGVLIDEASPILEGTIIFSLFNGSNTGILVSGATTNATIRNTRAVIQGPRSTGVHMQKQSNARVKESSFSVRSDNFSAGIRLEEASAKVTESTFIVGSIFALHLQIWGALLDGPSNLDSNQSNYESIVFAVQNAGTGQARFGASQLIGTASPALFGPLVCASAYDGTYTPLNNFCN